MKKYKETLFEMRAFLLLWLTQAFSGLGSAMTGYCLVIWSYTQRGSALMTSLLMKSPHLSMAMLACNRNSGFTSKISIPSVACHFKPSCLYSLNLQLFCFLSLKIETFKQDSCIFKTINFIHYLPLLHYHSTMRPLMSKHH